jgi:1-acyl-sn-glycerol-3-phosphate acyltransferase
MPLPPLPDPSSPWPRTKGLAKALPAVTVLGSALMAGNLAQLLSLTVMPLSRHAFRRINREIADLWWGSCVTFARRMNHTRIVFTGDPVPPRENALVIANHQQMPDITFLMQFARGKDRLGDMKWFVKDKLKYVPGIGWGMVFLDCLFVKRDWAADRGSVERTFQRILRDRVPIWLISFAEGTRITPDKLRASHEYAEAHGLEPHRHLLLPRTKGFVASVQGLRQHLDAVYDVTIGYELGVPTLWQFIKGYVTVAHLHVHRVPVAEMADDDEALAEWLQSRFREKDRLLEHFYRRGAFPD